MAGSRTYMTTYQCVGGDPMIVWPVVILCAGIMLAYFLIALDFWRNLRRNKSSPGKRSLGRLVAIFFLCAICGYALRIVQMWYVTWYPYIAALFLLNIVSWWYVVRSCRGRAIIIRELDAPQELIDKIGGMVKDARRLDDPHGPFLDHLDAIDQAINELAMQISELNF